MAKKHIPGTRALFEETEAVAEALAQQPEHAARDIPIARIVPSRYNPRQTYSRDALDQLARSMQEHGFIGALDGRELPDGRIELAYGSRRLLAARHAGLRSLPVALHTWTDAQMCVISLAENLARVRLSDVDEAVMVRQLSSDLKLTDKAIADALGRPVDWVESCLAEGDPLLAPAQDPDAAKLDEVVASLIGDSIRPDMTSSVFGLDVSRDATSSPLLQAVPARSRPQALAPVPDPGTDWVETGSTMLVLASDALQAFDPGAVAKDEIEAALGWLTRLEEQSALFRAELESRR